MRNGLIVLLIILTAFVLAACDSGASKTDNKYMINAVYSYGGDLEETVISYEVIISGDIRDIKNIDAYEVLINMKHLDLLIEKGHHSSLKVIEKDSYFPDISSSVVSAIDLLYGFEQKLNFRAANGGIYIDDLIIRDYPLVLRLSDNE